MSEHFIPLLRNRASVVWLVLVAATAFSWWMGASASADHRYVATLLIVVACVKCRLVIRYFMEVHQAGRVLRVITDLWVLVVGSALLLLYWQAV